MAISNFKDALNVWGILDKELQRPPLRSQRLIHNYPSEASVLTTDPVDGIKKPQGACLRANYFRQWNQAIENGLSVMDPWAVQTYTPTELWKFELGNMTEGRIREAAKTAGIYISNNVKFYNIELDLSGELDLVLLDPFKQTYVGAEIKSIYGYYGENSVFGTPTQQKKGLKGVPKLTHILQTAIYAWHWRHQIEYFVIMYISRGNAERQQFVLQVAPLDDDYQILIDGKPEDYTINDIKERYKLSTYYIENPILPPRDFDLQYSDAYIDLLAKKNLLNKTDDVKYKANKKVKKGDWMCSYCKWSHNCYDKKDNPFKDSEIKLQCQEISDKS